jgi:hypothetical protein
MPILDKWTISPTVDEVLRAQGADPDAIRSLRPAFIKSTEMAISIGVHLLHPVVLFEKYPVNKFVHDRLELTAGLLNHTKPYLSGPLIGQHLAQAKIVILMVCTIGRELDEVVSSVFKSDPKLGLALDGVGSAAVEMLAIQACNYFEAYAREDGYKTSMPLNPGMVGWDLSQGQLQIFTLLNGEEIHVSLTEACMMIPNKSLSMVLGLGNDLSAAGSSCDYCSLKGVCRYQNHYAESE